MMSRFRSVMFCAALGAAACCSAAEYNLLSTDRFTPVEMHGRVSAAAGWMMRDWARRAAFRGSEPYYVSGEDCFTLEVADGVLTIRFTDPLNPVYRKGSTIRFDARTALPLPPAPQYRFSGRAKFNRGQVIIGDRLRLSPSAEWKEFEYTGSKVAEYFAIIPEAGSVFSFADFKLAALYPPNTREAILLPGGGKLTKIVLQPDDSGLLRRQLLLWRGWLWKLTGVALPVEEVAAVDGPMPGALAVRFGEVPEGGWNLKVDEKGILLTVGTSLEISSALFDYLHRRYGFRYFENDRVVDVKCDPERALAAFDFTAAPKFHSFPCDLPNGYMSGGTHRFSTTTVNEVDYYHLPSPVDDHILNIIMPKELYAKSHPEYYMLDVNGKRKIDVIPGLINPCFSNPEVVDLCVKNLVKYAKYQPTRQRLLFYAGDAPWYCVCPKCLAVNGEKGGYGNITVRFMGRVAEAFAAAGLKHRVRISGYMGTLKPPKEKPDPRLYGSLSIGHDLLPCTLHVDCELNRPGLAILERWKNNVGGRDRLAINTYRDARPHHFLRQMEYINRHAAEELLIYTWHGYDPAIQYVVARWNLGTPIDEAIAEYDRGVYGKGAESFREVEAIVEEFCRNYQHTPEEFARQKAGRIQHIAVRCGTLETRSALDRQTFDRIYAAFDRALAAVGKSDPVARRHLLRQKATYLMEDLNVNRRFTLKSKAETAAFAERLALFCRIAREVPALQREVWITVSGRKFLQTVAGLTVPDTGKNWCFEPYITNFLKNPAAALPAAEAEKIVGGWHFPAAALTGGIGVTLYDYQCAPRLTNFVRRPSLGNDRIVASFTAAKAVKQPLWLVLTGLDDDKPGASELRVTFNGKVCFEGKVSFAENRWSTFGVEVPGVVAGKNEIVIENITPDTPSRCHIPGNATAELQWGWIAIAELTLLDPNGEFRDFAERGVFTRWRQLDEPMARPMGTVIGKAGKVTIAGSEAKVTGMIFCRSHARQKPALLPGGSVRIEATASGKGTLELGVWSYNEKNQHRGNRFKSFRLEASPRTFRAELQLPAGTATVLPVFQVTGKGSAEITDFRIVPVPPAAPKK